MAEGAGPPVKGRRQKKGAKREFDWSKATFGHYVLKLTYVGKNYHGNAWQEPSTCPTVEAVLFEALIKTCLIRDRTSCNFSRCGRTDKGVHAAGNYIALQLRKKPAKDSRDGADPGEFDYASMLNGVLPQDVRILAAAPAPDGFDARFSCKYRCYRYHFPWEGEDIKKMREAALHLVGEHDFRNFCKMDVENVTNFTRTVLSVHIEHRQGSAVGCFAVTGTAFLWHQVRCMAAILLMIGQGLEEPSIVPALLDVERHPRKPNYEPADESGLVLYDCGFEGVPFAPCSPPPQAGTTLQHGTASPGAMESLRQMHAQARRQMAVQECLATVAGCSDPSPATAGAAGSKGKRGHFPLMSRPKCPTLEEKQEALETKRRRKGEEKPGGPEPIEE